MGFTPSLLKKTNDITLFFFGACCKRGRLLYSTTAPSCCIPTSYCHLSATLQTMSIIVVNLQDNRDVFRIFIALLRFSFDSPSYIHHKYHSQCYLSNVRSYQKTDLYGHEKRAWKLYLLSDLLYVLTHRRCKGLSLRLITLSETLGRTPMEIVSVRGRDLTADNIQHSQHTDNHATGGIETRNPCERSVANLRRRPPGNHDSLKTEPCLLKFRLWPLL